MICSTSARRRIKGRRIPELELNAAGDANLANLIAATKEVDVPSASDDNLLEIILDSWDRNNRILINLLRALPSGGLKARVMVGSPSVAEMFTHIHFVRLMSMPLAN